MPIGDRIKELRIKSGLSQGELGYKVDTDSTIISRWETNRVRPGQKYIVRLAQALNTSTDYLLCDTDDPSPQVEILRGDLPEERSVTERNSRKLIYTFKDGEKLELPDTDKGYALFKEILMSKAVMV